MLTWTIGAGGLIGSAIHAQAESPFTGPHIRWSDPAQARMDLDLGLTEFLHVAVDRPWVIVWAAGAGTTVSSEDIFSSELDVFRHFLEQLRARAVGSSISPSRGMFVLISSAGGVHAGSINPPFSETTEPAPISAYGRAKLQQEELVASILDARVPSVICRVSNAYGPGQNLDKLQGLISRLALCTYRHEPLHLFVPITTVRDYIFTTDIAVRVHAWIDATSESGGQGSDICFRTVIIASGQGTSIAELIRVAGDVSHRRIPIAMGSHPSSSSQPADSRFIPTPLPNTHPLSSTNLPTGVKSVFEDVSQRLAASARRE